MMISPHQLGAGFPGADSLDLLKEALESDRPARFEQDEAAKAQQLDGRARGEAGG